MSIISLVKAINFATLDFNRKEDILFRVNKQKFIGRSLEIYKAFNEAELYYQNGQKYNKLVTADPYYITDADYLDLVKRAPHLWTWIDEQTRMFTEIPGSKSLSWIYDILARNHSYKTLSYQLAISKQSARRTKIMRVDLSSFPFNCHEAQLRWGAIGHISNIIKKFDQIVPLSPGTASLSDKDLAEEIGKLVRSRCVDESECCIYLTPSKFLIESQHFSKDLPQMIVMLVSDFNDQNFTFKRGNLVHTASGKTVRLIFRRELTLETLTRTQFGENVVKLYLQEELDFEPDLNLVNDSKLGMAFAFDPRTKSFFSDNSRNLFLKTCLFDDNLFSFNSVFGTDYTSFDDFVARTSQKQRSYIYKYGGYRLDMSFGSSHVYRLDRSKSKSLQIVNSTKDQSEGEWIIQSLDETRFKTRCLVGNYDVPNSCSIKNFEGSAARFMMFYSIADKKPQLISGIANFVTDYWKARFKDSDQKLGTGAIITPIRKLEQ